MEIDQEKPTVSSPTCTALLCDDDHEPDFNGKPILKSCENCAFNEDVSDGYEYGGPFYACTKEGKEHMSNLKNWPFKSAQKCFVIHHMFITDWAEVARKQDARLDT